MSSKNTSSVFVPDAAQSQAIEHVHGPMLVIAGAGTGKTSVLTRRIARLVHRGHARSDEILALTYTDNAAVEMRARVQDELGKKVRVQAKTFHAFCNELLERSDKKFGVLDEKDLWIYLRKRIRELHLNYFIRAANLSKFLDDLLEFMRRCQDDLVGPEKYAEYVSRLEACEVAVPRVGKSKDALQLPDEEIRGRCREIASVFTTVEKMLEQGNLGTFSHMITRAYALLCDDAELLARERAHARFILVDEFQDANFAQVKLLEQLAGEERNIFAVGDPDQAIYRFRGASSAAFGLFERHFPGAALVSLRNNQRSMTPILECAHTLISKNPPVFHAGPHARPQSGSGTSFQYQRSQLRSARQEAAIQDGKPLAAEPVEAVVWRERELESADLVGRIRQLHKKLRCSWSSFAIVYRLHAHRDDVVEELSRRNVPFSIENMDVLDTPEVRDLLACIGAVVSTADSTSLFRVAALRQFALDPEKLRAAMKRAKRESTLAAVLEDLDGGPAVLRALQSAHEEITRSNLKARAALDVLIRRFQLNLGSAPIVAVLKFVEAWEKKAITKTGEIAELIDYLEYFREARGSINLASEEKDAVRLVTAHATKGLEFDHVFIIRSNSGTFPAAYKETLFEFPRDLRDPGSIEQEDNKLLHEQEERRLFYVAITRARDSLSIYAKQGKGKDATPAGLMRDLLKDRSVSHALRSRSAEPMQVDLFAEEDQVIASVSNASQWLTMDSGILLTERLSATAVQLYENCPFQFKMEREWRIPGEIPAAMQYGASIHRILRTCYEAIQQQRPKSDAELCDLFRADLAAAHIEDRYQHELYEQQGLQQLRDFLDRARRSPQPEVLHTEKEFGIRIGEANIVGRIDRIDRVGNGRIVIVDYKTGKPRSQDDADESLQLSIYAIAAHEMWGYEAERVAFYNLEDNSLVSTTRSELQLKEARARVEEVAQKIAAGDFKPKFGFHCTFCGFRNLCPATEKRVYTIAPATRPAGRPV